jgi:S1-C subfamily serine protease
MQLGTTNRTTRKFPGRRLRRAPGPWTLAAIALSCVPLLAAESDPRRDAVVAAVERVMPSVVNVATEEVVLTRDPLEDLFREFFGPYYRRRPSDAQFSVGSGVIIDEEGFVLTNFHVVNRARRVWVKLSDGREFECDKIIGTSFSDVALLKIRAKPDDTFAAVRFAEDDALLLGETVLALGNPFGLGGSVSRGILSSKSRRPPRENETLDVLDWLQTDAAINPGNSGGPLINLRGELLGLNVAIHREAQGIGFAVPVKRIAEALAEIYSPEWLEQLWFGARVHPGARPLRVRSVEDGSPAAQAGLRADDRILQVDGRSPRSYIDFVRQLTTIKDRRSVPLQVERGAERKSLRLRLVPQSSFFNADLIRRRMGATLEELTGEAARALGWAQFEGLLVDEVEKPSPASEANLQRGMLVTSLDGQEASRLVVAAKTLHGKRKGDKVRLELVYRVQVGPFLEFRKVAAEVTLR